jgi:hypothetical protein
MSASARFIPPVILQCVLRGFTICFGIAAMVWGVHTFQIFAATSNANAIASRITSGAPYKDALLTDELAKAQSQTEVTAHYLRSIAIIRLRLTERDLAQQKAPTAALDNLEPSIAKALEYQPSDAYLWLALFWLRTQQTGLTPTALAALRMSYETGPHEGWVAVQRNRLAMMAFSLLPQDLKDKALAEFKLLVGSGYATQTADIFVGPAWPLHDQLLQLVTPLPQDAKHKFAMALQSLNDSIVVPGVTYPNPRH